MMTRLLIAHLAFALGAGALSAALRSRPFRPAFGVLDALVVLLLPFVGPATVLAGLALELVFRRRRAPAPQPRRADPAADDLGRIRPLDPVEELRIGTNVTPVAEVLTLGDLEEVDRALRRLVRSEDLSTLLLLRDALQSARLDVRVRARGLIVRIEDRLLSRVRQTRDPIERARAFRKLACLSADPISLQQHLSGAVAAYEEALGRDPRSPVGGELGDLLVRMGEVDRARCVLTQHLLHHPGDTDARLARAQASVRAADLAAARSDCAVLKLPALE